MIMAVLANWLRGEWRCRDVAVRARAPTPESGFEPRRQPGTVEAVNEARMNYERTILAGAAGLAVVATTGHAQPTVSASDLFNVPGQYYRAYANTPQAVVEVSELLGEPGSQAQAWNFLNGPQDVTYRFDYLTAADVPPGADFPLATVAEQKTDEAGVLTPAWLFFSQDPARGRVVYGFHDPGLGDVKLLGLSFKLVPPAGYFQPPLRDFPDTITLGSQWTGSTTYTNLLTLDDGSGDEEGGGLFDFPQQTAYTSTSKVDAFGVINLPGIGFGECLRINELVQYDLAVDMGSGWEQFGTAYLRNYYWVRPGRGIVAQITSEQQQTGPPPDNFPTAAAVLRMFETNHPDAEPPPPPAIQGLTLSLSNQGALLTWTRLAGITTYRVEHTSNPADPTSWALTGSPTTGNFLIDATANTPGAPLRYYRVVGLP